MVFSGYSGFFNQQSWPLRYNLNTVESGVNHHNPIGKINTYIQQEWVSCLTISNAVDHISLDSVKTYHTMDIDEEIVYLLFISMI